MNFLTNILNNATTRYLDTQVMKRSPNEAMLLRLFNQDELDLRVISTPVSRFLLNNHIEKLQSVGYGDFSKVSELVQSILMTALYNVAKAIYPDKMQALKENREVEPISFDQFSSDALQHVFRIIRAELIQVDEKVFSGFAPEKALFSPLSQQILDLLIPSNSGILDNWVVRPIIDGILSEELLRLYKTFFWKPVGKEDRPSIELDDFAGLIASCLDSLSAGVATNILSEMRVAPGLEALIHSLSSKFTPTLQEVMTQIFPLLMGISQDNLCNLSTALLLKGIVNIILADGIRRDLTLQETVEVVASFLRNRLFDQLLIINAKREAGFQIKRKDFEPCAKELFEALFSYDPLLCQLLLRRFPQVIKWLSVYLKEFEVALNTNQDREPVKGRLRSLLGELVKDELGEEGIQLSKDLSTFLGVEDVVTQLENICLHVGDAVLHHAEVFLRKRDAYQILAQLIAPLADVEDESLETCLKGLIPCFLGDDVQSENFKNYFRKQIAGIIFTVITNALEKGAEKGDVADALYYALQGLIAQFRKNDEQMPSGIINFLFRTKNNQQGLEDYLPLPKRLAEKLSLAVRSTFLPKMLEVLHRDTHLWIDTKADLRDSLDNDRMAELATVLGHFVEQFLPFFLREKSLDVSQALLGVTSSYLVQPPDLITQDNLKLGEEALKPHQIWQQWLSHAFEGLGVHSNKNNKLLFRFIRRYTEGFLLVLFINFKECLENSEKEHVLATKNLLEEGQEHFGTINRIKSSLREGRASKVAPEILIHHFSLDERLHPVMDLSSPSRAVQFYKVLSADLLKVMNLDDGVGLPAPTFLKPIVWELFEDLLLPRIVESLVDQIKSPDAIHHYLHSLLNAVSSSINDASDEISEEEIEPYDDDLQEEIEQLSGALLQELLGLQPTIAMPVLRFRKIQKRLGVSVGQSIRRALEQYTTLELVDLLIYSSMEALHKGRWVSKKSIRAHRGRKRAKLPEPNEKAERFFPIKLNEEGVEVKGWDFGFPKNRQAKIQVESAKTQARAELNQTVTIELQEMIHQQADLSIHDGIEGIWGEIQKSFDEAIRTVFGREGRKLKRHLDHICRVMWRYALYPLLLAVTFPLRKIGSAIFKVYYSHQARARVEDVGHPIHQNFFLHSLERVIHDLAEKSVP